MEIFGIDFGTTNSLAARILDGSAVPLLDVGDRPHPSVLWCSGGEVITGREAKRRLLETGAGASDDVVRSPKRMLGTEDLLHVGGMEMRPAELASHVFRHLRDEAAGSYDEGLERAVVTVPVAMRGTGRRQLRDAALRAGVHVEQFVHEPLAALYGHLRPRPDFRRRLADLDRRLALVFDWGGGTLDLTLCTLVEGVLVQVKSLGDDQVGGDLFDDRVVDLVRRRHIEEHGLTDLPAEMPGAAATLVERCEQAKITLSERTTTTVFLKDFMAVDGPARSLEVTLTRDDLVAATEDLVRRGMSRIEEILDSVRRTPAAVAYCVPTGGVTRMPEIRERLLELFGAARVPLDVQGDRVIAEGAAWIAHDNLRLSLAKPFEMLHADGHYYPVAQAGLELPRANGTVPRSLGVYCVDPRDGVAHIQTARPAWPGRDQPEDERLPYGSFPILVDPTASPGAERIEVSVSFDSDLIATVKATSGLVQDSHSFEVHDLEFGLETAMSSDANGASGPSSTPDAPKKATGEMEKGPVPEGAVRVRTNVAEKGPKLWSLVPGDIVQTYRRNWLSDRRATQRQRDELMYYAPCSICGRTVARINLDGCEIRGCPTRLGSGQHAMVAAFEERRQAVLRQRTGEL